MTHVLVMTATPIPRTLAMTIYGDLDVSVIDELPPGRKPVLTEHYFHNSRNSLNRFLRGEIQKGRQVYVVYPLIEESERMDYKNLVEGYEYMQSAFPEYKVCMVHGKLKPAEKDEAMQSFARGESQIMVATTVIEVGVNVPNASVMVIESAFCHKGGVICISEIVDISPGNLDSSLCFFQPSVSHDVLCI